VFLLEQLVEYIEVSFGFGGLLKLLGLLSSKPEKRSKFMSSGLRNPLVSKDWNLSIVSVSIRKLLEKKGQRGF